MTRAVAILTSVLWFSCGGLGLQAQPGTPASNVPRPELPGTGVTTGQSAKPLPPLPGVKTPADTLRELLAMSRVARDVALADRTQYERQHLEKALKEYESLPSTEREARLKQLELRCHLPVLMKLAPADRGKRMAAVPPYLIPLIEERLRQWDRLPTNMQQNVLEHETTSSYFLRLSPSEAPDAPTMASMPLANSTMDESKSQWAAHLTEFFELPAKEQQKTLNALPAAEREQMQRTLQAFADLPPEQRKICIDSFVRFNSMTVAERNQFLKNAARWKAMPARERATWRTLVEMLPPTSGGSAPPPLPPGVAPLNGATNASNTPPPSDGMP